MEAFSLFLSSLLFQLGPVVREVFVFVLGYVEGLPIIGSFVPGGTMALIIGSLSGEGFISPLLAINLLALGSFLGDLTGFVFGKKIRKMSYVKKIIEHEKHQKNWDLFDRHVALVIILGKLLPVVRSVPSLFAGARNIPAKRYVVYTLIASYLWAFVGIYAGNALANIFGTYAIPLIVLAILALFVATVIYQRHKEKKRKQRKEAQELLETQGDNQ